MRDYVFALLVLLLLLLAMARPFVGLMLYSWISFMNVHRLGWGMAAHQPWAMMAFAATLVGCVLAREPRRFQPTLMMILLVVFGVGITLTSIVALGPPEVVWDRWDRGIKVLIGLLLTAALLTEKWRVHAMVWLIVISLGYFGIRGGLFTLGTGGIHIVWGPPDSMIGDRNHLAVALLFAVPLMNWLRLQSPHRIVRIALIGAMILTVFSAVGSQSRGALVAMAAVAFVMWLRTSNKILSGTGIAIAVAAAIAFMPPSWYERMYTIETYEEDLSAMGRVNIWHAAFEVARARPLTGGGFRAVYHQHIVDQYAPGVRARAAHSIYFEVLGEHGFVMFGLWLFMIGLGVYYTMRLTALSRDRPALRWAGDLARMSQVSIVAYLVGGVFLSLAYWDVFWTLMVVLGASHVLAKRAIAEGQAPVQRQRSGLLSGLTDAGEWRRPSAARPAV